MPPALPNADDDESKEERVEVLVVAGDDRPGRAVAVASEKVVDFHDVKPHEVNFGAVGLGLATPKKAGDAMLLWEAAVEQGENPFRASALSAVLVQRVSRGVAARRRTAARRADDANAPPQSPPVRLPGAAGKYALPPVVLPPTSSPRSLFSPKASPRSRAAQNAKVLPVDASPSTYDRGGVTFALPTDGGKAPKDPRSVPLAKVASTRFLDAESDESKHRIGRLSTSYQAHRDLSESFRVPSMSFRGFSLASVVYADIDENEPDDVAEDKAGNDAGGKSQWSRARRLLTKLKKSGEGHFKKFVGEMRKHFVPQ